MRLTSIKFSSFCKSVGIFLWAKRLGGTGSDTGNSVATDASGNITVAGEVYSLADLSGDGDTNDGIAEASSLGSFDAIITKFDASGTHLWAKRLGGTNIDSSNSVTADISGNIIVTGFTNGAADLNGDGDTVDGTVESTGYGGTDVFISVFDSLGIPK